MHGWWWAPTARSLNFRLLKTLQERLREKKECIGRNRDGSWMYPEKTREKNNPTSRADRHSNSSFLSRLVYHLHCPSALYLHSNKAAGQLSLYITFSLCIGRYIRLRYYYRWSRYLYGWLVCCMHHRRRWRIRLRRQMYLKLCCTSFFRFRDRQQFEDLVSEKSECSFYINNFPEKKTLTIYGANLLWALILAPYL